MNTTKQHPAKKAAYKKGFSMGSNRNNQTPPEVHAKRYKTPATCQAFLDGYYDGQDALIESTLDFDETFFCDECQTDHAACGTKTHCSPEYHAAICIK